MLSVLRNTSYKHDEYELKAIIFKFIKICIHKLVVCKTKLQIFPLKVKHFSILHLLGFLKTIMFSEIQ